MRQPRCLFGFVVFTMSLITLSSCTPSDTFVRNPDTLYKNPEEPAEPPPAGYTELGTHCGPLLENAECYNADSDKIEEAARAVSVAFSRKVGSECLKRMKKYNCQGTLSLKPTNADAKDPQCQKYVGNIQTTFSQLLNASPEERNENPNSDTLLSTSLYAKENSTWFSECFMMVSVHGEKINNQLTECADLAHPLVYHANHAMYAFKDEDPNDTKTNFNQFIKELKRMQKFSPKMLVEVANSPEKMSTLLEKYLKQYTSEKCLYDY